MGKTLIIAEKPSVAQDIAQALSGFTRHDQYFESEKYVLSSAVGHLLELDASASDVKRGKWSFAHLPVLPQKFDLKPIVQSEDRLKLLTRLIKRKDVTDIINACDAGREGELIFCFLVEHAGVKKPVYRLWLQSMTRTAIQQGFHHLRNEADLRPLADAARSRAESDWLMGINGTRAMTAFNSQHGGFHKTPVGRVQTPTLSILVTREKEIRAFVSEDYWEVEARFEIATGDYLGRWFDPNFNKTTATEIQKPERIWDAARAEAIVQACVGKNAAVREDSKPVTQLPPLLFDLTSLQREANSRFGFSARTTLQLAQALYEKHKLITYPRTDSRALPEDYVEEVKSILVALDDPHATQILSKGWVRANKRIFNNSKISDHFAIIPTGQKIKSLSDIERKLYQFIFNRFIAIFYPAAEFLSTTRISEIGSHSFRSDGRVLVQPGWLEVYGREEGSAGEKSLPALKSGESAKAIHVEQKALQTRPPARYTEATLLSAMEGAGKLLEDEELRAAMGTKGLGTPATRAQIIEGLIQDEYIQREQRELQPTVKAFDLIFALEGLKVEVMSSPELTGQWEHKLQQIENGELSREEFMGQIIQLAQNVVTKIKNGSLPDESFSVLTTPCPKCGHAIKENYRKFSCQSCDYALWKVVASRQWAPAEIDELLTKKFIGPLTGFRSRLGRPFNALVRLNDEFQPIFDFGEANQTQIDISDKTPLGPCPRCKASVYDVDTAYRCATGIGDPKACDFRSGKFILSQAIDPEQMKKLLTERRTSLLKEFVSSRTRRRFSAYLVLKDDGKVGFEFEKKEFKGRGKKSAAVGKTKSSAAEPPKLSVSKNAKKAAADTPAKPKTRKVKTA